MSSADLFYAQVKALLTIPSTSPSLPPRPSLREEVEAQLSVLPSLPARPSLREELEAKLALLSSSTSITDSLREALMMHLKSRQWPMRSDAPSFHPSTSIGGCTYYGNTSDYDSSDEREDENYSSSDEENSDETPFVVVNGCTFYAVEDDFATYGIEDEGIQMEEDDEDESPDTIYGSLHSELREELGQRPAHEDVVARFVQIRMSYFASADKKDSFYQ